MNKPLLTIAIPTTIGRELTYSKLLNKIQEQAKPFGDKIEIITMCDDKEITIGEKRNLLYAMAKGEYTVQWDDDDDIAQDGILLIMEALQSLPDCVTYEEYIDIDGKIMRSNHSLQYIDWADNQDGYDFVRTPFMKSVIKTEIAKSVPIPHIRFGEDHQWSQALKPHLKTEAHIPKQIYKYIHRSSDFNLRYGIVERRNENSEPTNY